MQNRAIKIIGTGKYLPKNIITAQDLSKKLNISAEWIENKTGVKIRHYIKDETSSYMGAKAAREALENAGLKISDIDCIVFASGVPEQIIPCTASLMQKELGGEESGIPCFDIDSTCLSFVAAMDLMSYLVDSGRYKNVLIVSTEITSIALDWDHNESCCLFGDGAAAVIITKTPENEGSKIITSEIKTYSKGAHYSEVRGGGSKLPPKLYCDKNKKDFMFYMDGKKIYKMASQLLPGQIDRLLDNSNLKISDIDMAIPHQASIMSMQLIQKKLNIPDGKFKYIIQNHGNVVAASIPMTLYETIVQKEIQRGDKVMLMGVSAGLSTGVMIFEY